MVIYAHTLSVLHDFHVVRRDTVDFSTPYRTMPIISYRTVPYHNIPYHTSRLSPLPPPICTSRLSLPSFLPGPEHVPHAAVAVPQVPGQPKTRGAREGNCREGTPVPQGEDSRPRTAHHQGQAGEGGEGIGGGTDLLWLGFLAYIGRSSSCGNFEEGGLLS